MSVKAKMGDIEFEFETEADLRVFLAATRNGTATSQSGAPETFVQKLRSLHKRIVGKDRQRQLLKALLDGSESGLSDEQLRQKLGLKSNNELAGTVAGISKNARSVGLTIEHVLIRNKLANGTYLYRLTPDMRDILGSSSKTKSGA